MVLSSNAANLLFFGFYGWLILAFVFAANGSRDGSRRVANDRNLIIFRKRAGERIFGMMMCILIVVGVLLQYGQGMMYAIQHHQTVPQWAYFALLIGILFASVFGGLLLYLASPRDLSLDLDRRTYRFLSGWPLHPCTELGPLDDMAGIYVKPLKKGTNGYIVEIAWLRERHNCPMLGKFTREDDAKDLADQVSALLGLPRVAPPPVGKTAVDPVLQTVQTRAQEEASGPQPLRPFHSTLFTPSDMTEPGIDP